MQPPPRLERSLNNRVIAGVCGGLAEYLAVDATIVRIFFVIATVFTAGLFIVVYVALVFLMPLPGRPVSSIASSAGATAAEVTESLRRAADEVGQSFRGADPSAPSEGGQAVTSNETDRRRAVAGYALILLGVIFFLGNAGLFRAIEWSLVWPLAIVVIGVFLLVQRTRA